MSTMLTPAAAIALRIAGVWLCVAGLGSMFVKAQSEAEGGSSLISENIRSRGYQSFGLGIGFVGFSLMPLLEARKKDEEVSSRDPSPAE